MAESAGVPAGGDFTQLLEGMRGGDPLAARQLLSEVYQGLRRLAASKMAREAPGQTLEPTALVLGVSISTVERTWAFARAWLFREIRRQRN